MGLRHADRERTESQRVHAGEVLLGLRQVVDAIGTVQPRGDGFDLRLERCAVGREPREGVRLRARCDDGVREINRPVSTQGEAAIHDDLLGAGERRELLDQGDLLVRIGRKIVDRYHARQPVLLHDADVRGEVVAADS